MVFASQNTLMDYREMWHVRQDLGVFISSKFYFARLMVGVFTVRKNSLKQQNIGTG